MIPDRSSEQRLAALRFANEVRSHRATIKKALRYGDMTPATVLFSLGDPWLQGMKVQDVLLATPKLGRVKAARALRHCGVSPSKTIGGMTDRQREDLFAFFTENYPKTEVGSAPSSTLEVGG